jgi:hypothetical protein
VSEDRFLSRWSRRKLEAKSATAETQSTPPAAPAATAPASPPLPLPDAQAQAQAEPPLPPVESLTFESDFAAFMRPGVDEDLKRTALRALLRDPRFNVMDGLDVYIDDYSKPDPLPEGWLEKMAAVTRLGDYKPPQPEALEAEKNSQEQLVAPAPAEPEAPVCEPHSATGEEAKPQ